MCVSQTFLQVTLLIYLLAQATSFSRAVPDAVHSPYGCSFPHLNLNLKLSIFIFIPFSISQEQYHSLFQGVLRVYIISLSKSQPLNQSLLNSRLCLTVISYLSISISTSYPASIHMSLWDSRFQSLSLQILFSISIQTVFQISLKNNL